MLVPVLIPKDCLKALDFLANAKVRHLVGVKTENKFLFANTSDGVISVYDSVRKTCLEANLKLLKESQALQ